MRQKVLDQKGLYFITLTIVGWIDLFTRSDFSKIILTNLDYCKRNKGLVVYAYVIMPSHLHLIVKTKGGSGLSNILRDFKSFTAKQIVRILKTPAKGESRKEWLLHQFSYFSMEYKTNSNYAVWKPGSHPFLLYTPQMIRQKLDYIHYNPVKAEIVNEPENYIFSSASNYMNGEGAFEVEILEDIWWDEGFINLGY